MSGGGGGGGGDDFRPTPSPVPKKGAGGGGGNGGGGRPTACSIVETAPLNSPVPSILSQLKVGTVLDVVFNQGPPKRLEAHYNGQAAGSITSPNMTQMIECIDGGWEYQAVVQSVQGGRCIVRIEPK